MNYIAFFKKRKYEVNKTVLTAGACPGTGIKSYTPGALAKFG